MKRRIIALILSLALILLLCACTKDESASFKVTFIDVGQGDAALVECDGEYMLIDAGPNNKTSGEKIRRILLEQNIYSLKYLVISHLHDDHYGGIIHDALKNVTVERILCNEDPYKKGSLGDHLKGCQFSVPTVGDSAYKLGSATINIIDVSSAQGNDSLVLMLQYGKTNFLFTGDIEKQAHSRVAEELRKISDILESGDTLIKMPHHGAYNSDPFLPDSAWDNSLGTLISASYAKYFVISVGKNNSFGHPHQKTLDIIEQALEANNLDKNSHFFRTDEHGDVVFTSNGKNIIPQN